MSDLDFADDAVIFAEILDILLGTLEVLNEESEPLGLRVFWVKTKIQASKSSIAGSDRSSCDAVHPISIAVEMCNTNDDVDLEIPVFILCVLSQMSCIFSFVHTVAVLYTAGRN